MQIESVESSQYWAALSGEVPRLCTSQSLEGDSVGKDSLFMFCGSPVAMHHVGTTVGILRK